MNDDTPYVSHPGSESETTEQVDYVWGSQATMVILMYSGLTLCLVLGVMVTYRFLVMSTLP